MNIGKYLYNQNWNIGFADCSSKDLIDSGIIGKIHWMKHSYKDRFFADPFILDANKETITLFAEELEFAAPKGRLVELVVSRKDKRLLKRNILLELDSHLSYPAMLINNKRVYVYPENGASGSLSLYEYVNHSLKRVKTLIEEPLADSTILHYKDGFYLFATKAPYTQEDTFLYSAQRLFDAFLMVDLKPITRGKGNSRPAGNLFTVNGNYYRPAQNCIKRYGAAIEIMKILSMEPYQEVPFLTIKPNSFRYNLGCHTINFFNNICVIDGFGYLYPILGRFLFALYRIKQLFDN